MILSNNKALEALLVEIIGAAEDDTGSRSIRRDQELIESEKFKGRDREARATGKSGSGADMCWR